MRPTASKVAYVTRPRACETHETAAVLPAADAPARLMSLLAGPPPAAIDSAADAANFAPLVAGAPDEDFFPLVTALPEPVGGGGLPPVIGTPPTDAPPAVPPPGVEPPLVGPPEGPTGAVPEPATWAMMLVGFFGLGGAIRRKSRAARAA